MRCRSSTGLNPNDEDAGEQVDPTDEELLEQLLASHGVRCVYQPLVELDTGAVVAYEALARGPVGSPIERPDMLFAVARRARRLRDLDVACRVAALSGARAAGLTDPWRLFINAEPEALEGWRPPAEAADDVPLTVIVELTERALTARPAELLQTVARIREMGWGVALDDVGADPASLALLPLVRPDVIKLDLRLVQQRPTRDVAAVMNAVHAEAERSGSLVLAEGLETEQHVDTARALGATLGQGWLFGYPGDLITPLPPFVGNRVTIRSLGSQVPERSPFELGAACRKPRAATKGLLIELSKQLEAEALAAGESAMVLSTFQDHGFFTPDTRRRYAELAARAAFVGALGAGMPPEPVPGVRGAVLVGEDPLLGEWDIAVLGPHFAACLVARDLGDSGPDRDRRFSFVLSHDRDLTTSVAHTLMARIWPEPKVVDLPTLPEPGSVAVAAEPGRLPAAARRPPAPQRRADVRVLPPHLLDRALAAAGTGITVADVTLPDCPLVWVNPEFERLSGYGMHEVLGSNCRFLQGPGTDPGAVAEIAAAVASGSRISTRLLNYRADGTPWLNELLLSPVRDETGRLTHVIGVQSDVTARVEAEQRVTHLAYHDALTGLPNRVRLTDSITRSLARAARTGSSVALLFLDLDGFKLVNDDHGHLIGDELLRQVAARLRSALRADDMLARQGGDEFLVMLTDLPTERATEVAASVARQLLGVLAEPVDLDGTRVSTSASIGIAVAPQDGRTAEALMRHADAAMYAAKRGGAGRHERYRVTTPGPRHALDDAAEVGQPPVAG